MKNFRIVDLSWPIEPGGPSFPGDPSFGWTLAGDYASHGYRDRVLRLHSHTATHVDAPAHVLPGGRTLDRLPVDRFFGPACVADVRGAMDIRTKLLAPYQDILAQCDFVLLRTGMEKCWGSREYFESWPGLSPEAAQWLCGLGLKGVGVDAPSVDAPEAAGLPAHRALLESNMIVVENLRRLDELPAQGFFLSVLPLPITEADGSPVRAAGLIPG
jgi:kynurenine formamidase